MTTTPFETSLFSALTPFFSEHAFVLIPEKKQYRRTTDIGFQNIILSPSFYGNETILEVNFGCRNNQLEQIAQQFLNNIPDNRPEANTLILSIGRFNGFQYVQYKIHSEDDIITICSQIEEFFMTKGFNFLEGACSLANLDRILNEHPAQPCQYVYNQTHRYYKGLVAARLDHNPYFDGLIDSYRHMLIHQTQNPHERLHFERLIAYLHHYSAN